MIKAIHWELVPLTLIYIELKAHLLGIPYDKAHGLIARRKEYLFLSPFFLIKKKKKKKKTYVEAFSYTQKKKAEKKKRKNSFQET